MTARLLQILLQTIHPGPARSFHDPVPKTQSLIYMMRSNRGHCLLTIKMHLFTGSRPVAPTWFTPALSSHHSQGSGGGTSPAKVCKVTRKRWLMEKQRVLGQERASFIMNRRLLLPGRSDGGPQLLPRGRRRERAGPDQRLRVLRRDGAERCPCAVSPKLITLCCSGLLRPGRSS